MNNKIYIFSEKNSSRLQYICHVIFERFWGVDFEIISSKENIKQSQNIINYSNIAIDKAFQISPHKILFLDKFEKIEHKFYLKDEISYPFATQSGDFPIDPFALTFYFLTLYHDKEVSENIDEHQRVIYDDDIRKILESPIVDLAIKELKVKLLEFGFKFKTKVKSFVFTPTFDIDIAFAHLGKTLSRHFLGSMALALKLDFATLWQRFSTWRAKQTDPFNVFGEILNLLDENNLDAYFFALVADKSKFDNNNLFSSKSYSNLLKNLSEKHEIGLHSSYNTLNNNNLIKTEKKRLEDIIEKKVKSNRQHFIRFRSPELWNSLEKNGFENDFSVGFYSQWGYRAGTVHTFPAFDLEKNRQLKIDLHPFIFMDGSMSKVYNNDNQAIVNHYLKTIAYHKKELEPIKVIWHNHAMPRGSEEFDNFEKIIKLHND